MFSKQSYGQKNKLSQKKHVITKTYVFTKTNFFSQNHVFTKNNDFPKDYDFTQINVFTRKTCSHQKKIIDLMEWPYSRSNLVLGQNSLNRSKQIQNRPKRSNMV